jgi:dedicated sortase system histidine kinase
MIRTRLLVLGLATLALPWAGCRYAREMEASLRAAESAGLVAVAQAIATSLQGRRDLLYRGGDAGAAPGQDDAEPVPLTADPQLDGSADDWPRVERAWRHYGAAPGEAAAAPLSVLTGTHGRYLYVLLVVRDGGLVYDASDAGALVPEQMGDRIWVAFAAAAGTPEAVFISGWGLGALRGRRIVRREFGRPEAVEEARVRGAWRPAEKGWTAELRLPLSMIGERFGVLVDLRDRRGAEPRSVGNLSARELEPLGRIIAASPELEDYLSQFSQPGVRIVAASPAGATLAEADALPVVGAASGAQALLSRLYRQLLDRDRLAERVTETERGRIDSLQACAAAAGRASSAVFSTTDERRVVVAAAAPIRDTADGRVLGVLQVAQTADRWLLLRDQALTQLLNRTLLATAIAIALVGAFGAALAVRLERLRRASDEALTREGRVRSEFPDVDARDELGDVARAFSRLLGRLDEYTTYLRTLAGKLAHEIRTPLTIVRSSLDNLESEPLGAPAAEYVARARAGSERLGAILKAMGEATRVEEAIAAAEFAPVDVAALLRGARSGYATAFPARRFALECPDAACVIDAAPELVLQMLDKLVDNAVDFSPASSTITLRLLDDPARPDVAIDVENRGPTLPPGASGRLFESLWQRRPSDGGEKPHFGLGLYIVKLIATEHGGSAEAADLEDGAGVRFRVRLARQRGKP